MYEFIIGYLMGCLWIVIGYYIGSIYQLKKHIETVKLNIEFCELMNKKIQGVIESCKIHHK